MKYSVVQVCLLLAVLVGPSVQINYVEAVIETAKEFLGIDNLEEAPYNLISKNEEYEVREYLPRKWLCASPKQITSKTDDVMERSTFFRLFNYIDGQNDAGVKMPMTTPVSMEFTGTTESGSVVSCFYINQEYQDSPPKPNDETLSIINRDSMVVFVKRFGGYAFNMERWMEEFDALKADLNANGEQYSEGKMYMNGFNSPMKFWSRRNEVWMMKNNNV